MFSHTLVALVVVLQISHSPDAERYIAAALASRASIKHAHGSIGLDVIRPNSTDSNSHYDFVVWQTPDQYRVDITKLVGGNSREAAETRRFVTCDNCERPGWLVSGNDGMLAVEFQPPVSKPGFAHMARSEGIDLRLLGMGCLAYPNLLTVDEPGWEKLYPEISDPEYQSFRVTAREPDGTVRLGAKNIRNGIDLSVWIAPALGHAITRVEGVRVDAKTDTRYEMNLICSGHRNINASLYYPTSITHQRSVGGKLLLSEKYTVSSLVINEPPEPAIFTLAGMKFSNGKSVILPESPTTHHVLWDGRVVAARSVPQLSGIDARPPVPANAALVRVGFPWGSATGALLFACVAAYFLRRLVVRGG